MDISPDPGPEDPDQTFIDFAELVSALGDIVPGKGLSAPYGMLSARDFHDWLQDNGVDVLTSRHVVFPDPNRLRDIAEFIALVATVSQSAEGE